MYYMTRIFKTHVFKDLTIIFPNIKAVYNYTKNLCPVTKDRKKDNKKIKINLCYNLNTYSSITERKK